MTPKIGQIWKDCDPRIERYILIMDAASEGDWYIRTCTIDGDRLPSARVGRARADRFNGKRGGYVYVKDKE